MHCAYRTIPYFVIDPVGDRFVNALNRQRGDASITFSDLNEDLWSAGADLSYQLLPALTATVGYAFSDTKRTSSRSELHFAAPNLPIGVQQLRPDYLFSAIGRASCSERVCQY